MIDEYSGAPRRVVSGHVLVSMEWLVGNGVFVPGKNWLQEPMREYYRIPIPEWEALFADRKPE